MNRGLRTVIYPVGDLPKATAFYRTLAGAEPFADEPHYVGFMVGDQQIGLDPQGHAQGMTGPVGYWHVDDIEASLQDLLAAGAETRQAIREVGGGRRIATVADADGNEIGLLQDG